MKVKTLFLGAIVGIAVVGGVIRGLWQPQNGKNKEEEEEKEEDKEGQCTGPRPD